MSSTSFEVHFNFSDMFLMENRTANGRQDSIAAIYCAHMLMNMVTVELVASGT